MRIIKYDFIRRLLKEPLGRSLKSNEMQSVLNVDQLSPAQLEEGKMLAKKSLIYAESYFSYILHADEAMYSFKLVEDIVNNGV